VQCSASCSGYCGAPDKPATSAYRRRHLPAYGRTHGGACERELLCPNRPRLMPARPGGRTRAPSAVRPAQKRTRTAKVDFRAGAGGVPASLGRSGGWLAGVPFLTRRTCSIAVLKSTCSQRRSQTSTARNPWRKVRRTISSSRWAWRLPFAASIKRSTSSVVRCSRVRKSAFFLRRAVTVRFSVAGATMRRCDLAMVFQGSLIETVQTIALL
jgi:hypothetical protein